MDGDNENGSLATNNDVSTEYKDNKGKSHLSIEEFLNFLKTAYQVIMQVLSYNHRHLKRYISFFIVTIIIFN